MAKSKNDLNYMKQGEKVSGGIALHHLTNTFFRLSPGKKLTDDKEIGVNGFIVEYSLIKSRSNASGRSFEVVFDTANGISNFWTNYLNLKNAGLISGAGRSFKLEGLDDIKFAQKDAKTKYDTIPAFKEAFDREVQNLYAPLLNDSKSNIVNPYKKVELDGVDEEVYEKDGEYYVFTQDVGYEKIDLQQQ